MADLNDLDRRVRGFIAEYEAGTASFRKTLGEKFDGIAHEFKSVHSTLTRIESNLEDIRTEIFRHDVSTLQSFSQWADTLTEMIGAQKSLEARVKDLEEWRNRQAS